jgi:hypothetical protein
MRNEEGRRWSRNKGDYSLLLKPYEGFRLTIGFDARDARGIGEDNPSPALARELALSQDRARV